MNRFILTALLLVTWAISAMAASAQTPSGGDVRIRTLQYDASEVFRLRVATGYQVTILFSPEERVESVGIGDSDGWQVTLNGEADALFVKPVRSNGTTNMTVISDVRVYNFELTAAHTPGTDTPFTVRFLYSDPSDNGTPEPEAQLSIGRYRMSGARNARPVAISDDGIRTYIEWSDDQAIPAVFAIDSAGHERLIEGQVRNGLYVIDGVYQALLFRLDRRSARASRTSTGLSE